MGFAARFTPAQLLAERWFLHHGLDPVQCELSTAAVRPEDILPLPEVPRENSAEPADAQNSAERL